MNNHIKRDLNGYLILVVENTEQKLKKSRFVSVIYEIFIQCIYLGNLLWVFDGSVSNFFDALVQCCMQRTIYGLKFTFIDS